MSQRNQEKDCNGKRSFPKEERTLEGRTEKKPQEKNDQNADLERNPLLRRDMDNETGGHSKTGGFRNMDMAKNGKNQLDGTYIERRSVNIGSVIHNIHNQSKTKKLDGTPAERRLSSERNNGGKNGGEERKRKT